MSVSVHFRLDTPPDVIKSRGDKSVNQTRLPMGSKTCKQINVQEEIWSSIVNGLVPDGADHD